MIEVEERSRLAISATGFPVLNYSQVDDVTIAESAGMREVAYKLSSWVDSARSTGRGSMFERNFYSPPNNPYEEMRVALHALEEDDIVGGVAEITESFAFQGVKWESKEPDDADVLNQLSADLNLDDVIRCMWQEEYCISQYVAASVWGWRDYTVRGQTQKGNKRKKSYRIWAPVSIHVIDSRKIVPVGQSPLAYDYLAWCSTNGEVNRWSQARRRELDDSLMAQFYLDRYVADDGEKALLAGWGVDVNNLLLLNPETVWRHTLTRPSYKRFAPVRLKGVFSPLDMKRQLMASDRATLIGAANYILLVRKGTKEQPGTPAEIEHLKDNYNFIAKLPVIISDHRLEIEIIAPKTDLVLQSEKYDVLDQRILSRLLGTLSLGGRGQRNETNLTLARATAKGMENRRHMIRRDLEQRIARRVVRHPRNRDQFDSEPNLVYTPRTIALDIDAIIMQSLMALRQSKEISRETILEHFGLDQAAEAQRREFEDEHYDDIFETQVPFSTPNGDGEVTPPGVSGPQGGRPRGGGGSSPAVTKPKNQTERGNPSTGN